MLKRFAKWLYESVGEKPDSVPRNTNGVLHELLVGYHLNGGKHMDKHPDVNGDSPAQAHEKLRHTVSPEAYKDAYDRAKFAADDIKKNLSKYGKIQRVQWASKPGDIKRITGIDASQTEDPSDIIVTTHKNGEETHHGISLKMSKKKASYTGTSSLGHKSVPAASSVYRSHLENLDKEYPALAKLTNKPARKAWLEQNPQVKNEIKSKTRKMLTDAARDQSDYLNQLPRDEYMANLRKIMAAHQTPLQKNGHRSIRHTTYGSNGKYSADETDAHADSSHIFADPNGVTHEHSGQGINFYHNGKMIAKQSLKLTSQSDPKSPLQAWGTSRH